MEQEIVKEIIVMFMVALVGGFIAIRLKQPALIGYLIGGVVLSLFFSSFINVDISRGVAQIGIALLLFTTGLEFPISKLLTIRKTILFGAFLQLLFFVGLSTFVFSKFNFSNFEALFLSAAFSNSATVVVLKLLENEKIDIKISDNIVSWLILQDIAMVVIAVVMQALVGNGSFSSYDILESIAKSLVLIILAIVLGRTLIPRVFEAVSKLNSFELLLIISFVFCMGVAYFADIIGLSYTLGAFLAGVMISESFVNHEIFSEVRPLRDLFSVVFYVTLGTLLSPSFLLANIFKIILVLVGLFLLKFITSFIVIVLLEKQSRTAFVVSMILNQGGEFTFILAQIGFNNGWISEEFYSLNLIVSILSLLLTPVIIKRSSDWYVWIREYVRAKSPKLYRLFFIRLDRIVDIDQPDISDHVVICGFGRVGTYIGRALERSNVPFIVIDSNTETIDYCKQRGIKVVFGDASNIDVLEKADVERAKAIVIALPEEGAVEIIASNARSLNSSIKIIARSHTPIEDGRLKSKGVTITVEPEFEAAVSISKKILNFFGKGELNVAQYLKKSRRRQRSKIYNSNIKKVEVKQVKP
ncbi:cation:proton antiporter [Candidatus Dojkabacteria bacterium]|nr:cation:proton antiporter [Candidatus Dojkabacteria bacterium]